ncbi:hypothetical protein TNCV_4040561 [Trichonephila clavipes]|nr:hypothetical protein TNCV_4040561 [Trichonephila clavipes]
MVNGVPVSRRETSPPIIGTVGEEILFPESCVQAVVNYMTDIPFSNCSQTSPFVMIPNGENIPRLLSVLHPQCLAKWRSELCVGVVSVRTQTYFV